MSKLDEAVRYLDDQINCFGIQTMPTAILKIVREAFEKLRIAEYDNQHDSALYEINRKINDLESKVGGIKNDRYKKLVERVNRLEQMSKPEYAFIKIRRDVAEAWLNDVENTYTYEEAELAVAIYEALED